MDLQPTSSVYAARTERTRMVLGDAALDRLRAARVAIFGLGGVGGAAAEALARAGIGALTLIDNDRVAPSNLNRQLIATVDTLGLPKTQAAAARIAQVAPDCRVEILDLFYLPDTADRVPLNKFDYIVDAIDTVTAKLCLIQRAGEAGVPIISAMGTGCKLDPARLRIDDIYDTAGDPLARIMRKELRKRGVKHLTCVWSPEPARRANLAQPNLTGEANITAEGNLTPRRPRDIPGSTPFVPNAAGLILASRVVRHLIGELSSD